MQCKFAFFLVLTFLPVISFAATIQAGFPTESIWASASSAIEGETIVVSAIVLNGGTEALHATLVFTANDTRIGAREFELPNGKSQIHSIEWKPKKGEYRLAAKIEGTSAQLSQRETPSTVVTITEPPPPSAVQKTISQVARGAATIASSSAPVIMQAAQALFAQTEALRNDGVERLEKYLAAHATRPSAAAGNVAGASTSMPASNVAGFGASGEKDKGAFSNIAQSAAAAALFTMKNAVLFYPLLALLVLGSLYALARRVRRRHD